jgi:enoyl-CoA hydratase/carnithine racemase
MSMGEVVVSADEGQVRTITLNRPRRLNAFTSGSYQALAAALRDADREPAVGAVVLTGAGRAFSSGVDLDALATEGPGRHDLAVTFNDLLETLMAFSKPLLAAVHGVAVGFGATILLHCDFVIVAADARIRFPFTSLGTAPEAGSSVLLSALIGPQRAAELLYTSRWVSGAEAVSLGLAASCHPADEVPGRIGTTARLMAAQPGEAVAAAKRLIRSGRRDVVRAALARETAEAGHLREVLGPLPNRPPRDGD